MQSKCTVTLHNCHFSLGPFMHLGGVITSASSAEPARSSEVPQDRMQLHIWTKQLGIINSATYN